MSPQPIRYPFPKRLTDKIVSVALLALLLPVFAFALVAIAVAALLSRRDRGALLYREKRISRGREFDLLKFRTLRRAGARATGRRGGARTAARGRSREPDLGGPPHPEAVVSRRAAGAGFLERPPWRLESRRAAPVAPFDGAEAGRGRAGLPELDHGRLDRPRPGAEGRDGARRLHRPRSRLRRGEPGPGAARGSLVTTSGSFGRPSS